MQELVMKMEELNCVKTFVKKGFLDEFELKQMFENADTKKQLSNYSKYSYWTYNITRVLEDKV